MRLGHFRTLVVVSWCLYVVYWFHTYLPVWMTPYVTWVSTYDPHVVAIMQAGGYGALARIPHLISVLMFWGWLFAAVGVFFRQNWGRYLYLALLIAGFIEWALSGMITLTPFEAVLLGLVNVLDGAVVAIAFFSPFSSQFAPRPPSNNSMQPSGQERPAAD